MVDLLLEDARRLGRAGKLDEAISAYRRVLSADPQNLEALRALGRICFQTEQFELAQHFMGEALRLDPNFLDGLRVRGLALMQLKRHKGALRCFARALSIEPDSVVMLVNHATALLDMNRLDDALAGFDRVVALDPRNAVGWNNRGNTLVAMRRLEEAVTSYDRALAICPTLPTAVSNRFLALLELKKVNRMPDFAVRDAFDPVASRFDQMVLEELDYRSHLHLRSLADRVLSKRAGPWRILDIGCGTGLVGEAFKDIAAGGRIDGIDIAPRMIEEARRRDIYKELIVGDFESLLAASGPTYDLIVSADALVYLGDLKATFSGVAKRLKPGGTFLFTCEARDDAGWELTSAKRFRHSECYLRQEAERAGLSWVELMVCTPRRERGVPVSGFAVALRKT